MNKSLIFGASALLAAAVAAGLWAWAGNAGSLASPALGALLPGAPARPDAPPAGVHKCVGGGRTVYTEGACPAGSHESAMGHGTVSVMPASPAAAQSPAQTSASAAASGARVIGVLPGAREMLPDREREQMIERQIDGAMRR